jgi:hypothetical protein
LTRFDSKNIFRTHSRGLDIAVRGADHQQTGAPNSNPLYPGKHATSYLGEADPLRRPAFYRDILAQEATTRAVGKLGLEQVGFVIPATSVPTMANLRLPFSVGGFQEKFLGPDVPVPAFQHTGVIAVS